MWEEGERASCEGGLVSNLPVQPGQLCFPCAALQPERVGRNSSEGFLLSDELSCGRIWGLCLSWQLPSGQPRILGVWQSKRSPLLALLTAS